MDIFVWTFTYGIRDIFMPVRTLAVSIKAMRGNATQGSRTRWPGLAQRGRSTGLMRAWEGVGGRGRTRVGAGVMYLMLWPSTDARHIGDAVGVCVCVY